MRFFFHLLPSSFTKSGNRVPDPPLLFKKIISLTPLQIHQKHKTKQSQNPNSKCKLQTSRDFKNYFGFPPSELKENMGRDNLIC